MSVFGYINLFVNLTIKIVRGPVETREVSGSNPKQNSSVSYFCLFLHK